MGRTPASPAVGREKRKRPSQKRQVLSSEKTKDLFVLGDRCEVSATRNKKVKRVSLYFTKMQSCEVFQVTLGK